VVGPDFGTPTLGRPSKGAEGARSNRHGDAQERPEGFSELYNLDPANERHSVNLGRRGPRCSPCDPRSLPQKPSFGDSSTFVAH